MFQVFIGLGSNLGDSADIMHAALLTINTLPGCQTVRCSHLYRSKPMGPQDQPDYLNAVAELKTDMSPIELLDALQAIETEYGRVRNGLRWGPRTLDLDILLYAELKIQNERLTIPHIGIAQRNFVLYPLQELVGPKFVILGVGVLADCLDHCADPPLICHSKMQGVE
ncbi:2-amino-4-hydroxy-6-hydroxymethyldihydropteridinepyrophosphokinase [hydrothermal vent metagenome]|uniref:2-amino-4-hydroxy-6-hydroxymethyldihydropteridine diphosphokinase n=1 Tax=hydrothermal vent metagenome TaxID=652676 RepID=A0A3B0ZB54_9ZZZZ